MEPGPASQLRARGLRVTRPRLAVLAVLEEARAGQQHLPVSAIVERARARAGALSTQAVYDGLEALTRSGLVRRIEPAGSPARFEARVGDNHHHLVCRSCGHTTDVDCTVGTAPCLTPASTAGFVVDEAEVVFWGRCESCASQAAGASPEAPAQLPVLDASLPDAPVSATSAAAPPIPDDREASR